jgi:hypothetical protein
LFFKEKENQKKKREEVIDYIGKDQVAVWCEDCELSFLLALCPKKDPVK